MNKKRLLAVLAAGILSTTFVSPASVLAETAEVVDSGEGVAVPADGSVVVDGDTETAVFSEDGTPMVKTVKATELSLPVQDSYEYPFMGLKAVLPDSLKKQMENSDVIMTTAEDWTEDMTGIKYAYLHWNKLTEDQKDADVNLLGTGYEEWLASIERIGTLGVYSTDVLDDLDEITGCTEHKELGESEDGKVKYYLSLNKDADESLASELKEIQATLTEITPPQQLSAFDQPQAEASTDTAVGNFQMNDVDGTSYDQSLFADNEVTLVNVFTTWCSPCVNEIPELQKLSEQMKEQGVGVVGVVLDTVSDGSEDSEAIQKAQLLREKTGASYPFLIPDDSMMNGHLNGISAFPHSFFVDKNGNILGEAVEGSHDLEGWTELVNAQLEALKG